MTQARAGGFMPLVFSSAALSSVLSRRTSSTAFIPQIDGLRFYAVVAVLWFHVTAYLMTPAKNPAAEAVAATWLGQLSRTGHSGVELFFVISGFILGLPFARAATGRGQPVAIGRYFLRRLTRLEPPYIINLLLLAITMVMLGKASWAEITPHLIASLTYCHNTLYGAASAVNFVAWTLEIEVQFYLLAPFLAAVFTIQNARVRTLSLSTAIAAAAATSAMSLSHPDTPASVRLSLAAFLQYFLAGFAIADWYARGGDKSRLNGTADLLALPCVAAAMALELTPMIRALLLPVVFSALCYSALKGRWHSRLVATPGFVIIGGMCYTIYLYHPPIKSVVGPWIVQASPAAIPTYPLLCAQLVVFGVTIVAICAPLFLFFEKPFMATNLRLPPFRRGDSRLSDQH